LQPARCVDLSSVGRAGVRSHLLLDGLRRYADAAGRSSVRAPRPALHCAADKEAGEGMDDWGAATIANAVSRTVKNIYGGGILITRTYPETQLAGWVLVRRFAQPQEQMAWIRLAPDCPPRPRSNPSTPRHGLMIFRLGDGARSAAGGFRLTTARTPRSAVGEEPLVGGLDACAVNLRPR
jgi:hypothetical protein